MTIYRLLRDAFRFAVRPKSPRRAMLRLTATACFWGILRPFCGPLDGPRFMRVEISAPTFSAGTRASYASDGFKKPSTFTSHVSTSAPIGAGTVIFSSRE